MDSKYKALRQQSWAILFGGLAISTWLLVSSSNFVYKRINKSTASKNTNGQVESNFNSDFVHKAFCGLDLQKCSVEFKKGTLIVSDLLTIKRSQFQGVLKSTECRQRFLLMPIIVGCLKSQRDKDFTISYRSSNGLVKSIQISFRPGYIANQSGWINFQKDLQAWTEDEIAPLKLKKASRRELN